MLVDKFAHLSVDPSLLPAAGTKTAYPVKPGPGLEARRAKVRHFHQDNGQRNRGRLLQAGQSTIYGPPTPRAAGGKEPPSPHSRPLQKGQAAMGKPLSYLEPTQAAPTYNVNRHDPRLRRSGVAQRGNTEGLDLLIEGLRARIQKQGLGCAAKLEKLFAAMDHDSNGMLTIQEFKSGMLALNILKESEAEMLFPYFDQDGSGEFDIIEFSEAVRGKLSEARRAVVHEAFATLDKNGDGTISVDELKKSFGSYLSPDCIQQRRSEEEVFQEFCDISDNVNRDGLVSRNEFEHYYEYLSETIDSDALFIASVRNAWRLPGATGGPKCLKVHITRDVNNGRNDKDLVHPTRGGGGNQDVRGYFNGIGQSVQELVEIRPDVGLNKQDPAFFGEVNRRLVEMGYTDVVSVEVVSRR